jgi:predicted amidophosphoribosyltransferase
VALMQFEEESTSRKIIHQLKYGKREKIGEILAKWTLEKIDFLPFMPDIFATVQLHQKKFKVSG